MTTDQPAEQPVRMLTDVTMLYVKPSSTGFASTVSGNNVTGEVFDLPGGQVRSISRSLFRQRRRTDGSDYLRQQVVRLPLLGRFIVRVQQQAPHRDKPCRENPKDARRQ